MRRITLSIFLLISFVLMYENPVGATRGISVISDLNHKSGKLGAYRALIIGINAYKDKKIPNLKTAVNDAETMAGLLREKYGFKVQLLLDEQATKKSIYQALRKLAVSAKPNDSVLIYYAGHGDLDRTYNDGWWIPSDATGGDPITYLDNFQVQKAIRSMKARHVLLISDSCYSGTLFGQIRAMPQIIDDKYYLNLYNEKSRWGLTSGNKTPVSDQGSGGHSVFAYQLIKELRENEKPYISTQEICTRIAPIIGNNSEQIPVCRPIRNAGDLGGEFIFIASNVPTPQKTIPGVSVVTNIEPSAKNTSGAQIKASNRMLKAAIFPNYRINHKRRDGLAIANRRDIEIQGIYKVIMDTYNVHIEYSFLDKPPPTGKNFLFTHTYDKNIAKNTWIKKDCFFCEKEPNDLFIFKIGEELNIDLVFLMKKVWKPNYKYQTYIYDIASKEKYNFIAKHNGDNYGEAFFNSISSVFEIYFRSITD